MPECRSPAASRSAGSAGGFSPDALSQPLARVRGVFGDLQLSVLDQVDPSGERRGKIDHEILERPLAQPSRVIEFVRRDLTEISFGLLHDRHVQEYA